MNRRVYVTLSAYSRVAGLLQPYAEMDFLDLECRESERRGLYGLHISTIDVIESDSISDHMQLCLDALKQVARKFSEQRSDVTFIFRIFHSSENTNDAFGITPEAMRLLSDIGADLSVDIWNNRRE